MPKGWSKLKLIDLDDLFAYKTPRTVMIRDRKLGITRILLLLGLFLYVVVYEVILQKGYLVKELPVGYARISLQQISGDNAFDPYCCSYEGCNEAAYGSSRGRLPCVVWGNYDSVVPPAEEFSAFLTTRVTVTEYAPIETRCRLNASIIGQISCPSWQVASGFPKKFYNSGAEKATMLVRHAVYGHKNNLVLASTTSMPKARLANANGDYIKNFCDLNNTGDMDITCEGDNPAINRVGDILTVTELLDATDIKEDPTTKTSLDRLSTSRATDTMRYDGVVVIIVIDYAGTGYTENNVKYTYRVKHVPGAEYKYEEVKDVEYMDPTTNISMVRRTIFNRHGVRVLVIASGWMGKFSFLELLKTLVAGMALLAIAGTVTDYVVMRLLPAADIYRRYKNVKTVDFSDLEKGSRKLKGGKSLTWGGTHLTDETFVYGELSDDEKEESDKTRQLAEAAVSQTALTPEKPEPINEEYPTNPLEDTWDDRPKRHR